jgi:putative tricarboxylic transport membrane protein
LDHLIRNPKDLWSGIIYLVFGAAAVLIGRDYDMGTAVKMGPAYFPTILGILLLVVGCMSLIRSFFRPGDSIGVLGLKGLVPVMVSILLFGVMLRTAGLLFALPALVIISSCASRRFQWKYTLILAVGLTVFCMLVFQKGLGVPIPLLGAWFDP